MKITKNTTDHKNPARDALRRLSDAIRAKIKQTGCNTTINEVLEELYRAQSGQTDFDTFNGWKKRGFIVEKGQKGYPLWSKPKSRAEIEKTEADDGATEVKTKIRQSFWVSYIFSAAQVRNVAGERPATYAQGARLCLPPPAEYRADLDTIHAPKTQVETPAANDFVFCDDVPETAQPAQFEFAF